MAKPRPWKSKAVNPPSYKTPRRVLDPEEAYFVWRASKHYIDCDNQKLGWNKVPIAFCLTSIIPALHSYEGQKWKEVRQKPHCHPWDVEDIPKEFYERLQQRQIDAEGLFQISLGGKPRVFGHKAGGYLYLIWYDPDHKFWPTEPKNT